MKKLRQFSIKRLDAKSALWSLLDSKNNEICLKSLDSVLKTAGFIYHMNEETQATILNQMTHKHDFVTINLDK